MPVRGQGPTAPVQGADGAGGTHVPTAPAGRSWPVPTWRLPAALLGIGLALLLFSTGAATAAIAANAFVALAVVVDLALAPSPRTIGVRRDVDRVMSIDVPGPLRWTVANPARRSVTIELADALPESLRVDGRRARLRIPAGGRRHADRTLVPARRGTIAMGPITLRVHGPLGLLVRQADVAVHDEVRVHPAFPSREDAELALQQAQRQSEGLRTIRLRGQGTDFESLREYTPDDESRRIDWAATARAQKPIVRTYRAERNQQVLVLLDHGRTMAGRMGRTALDDTDEQRAAVAPRLEHAMDAVMALTRVATGMGDRVGLVAFSDAVGVGVPPRAGSAQLSRIVQALADVELDLVEPDYRAAFAETLVRHRRRALVIVMTDLAAAPVTQSLIPAAPLLSRRHLLMVGSATDPTVRSWTTGVPRDAAAAYRMAAALKAEGERRRSARLLRNLGAEVVDEPPAVLPTALIDAYLDLKSTGRL
jgi:uncharacterized protein (DUF58 family)